MQLMVAELPSVLPESVPGLARRKAEAGAAMIHHLSDLQQSPDQLVGTAEESEFNEISAKQNICQCAAPLLGFLPHTKCWAVVYIHLNKLAGQIGEVGRLYL